MSEHTDYLLFLLSQGIAFVEAGISEGKIKPDDDLQFWLRLSKMELLKYDNAEANLYANN